MRRNTDTLCRNSAHHHSPPSGPTTYHMPRYRKRRRVVRRWGFVEDDISQMWRQRWRLLRVLIQVGGALRVLIAAFVLFELFVPVRRPTEARARRDTD